MRGPQVTGARRASPAWALAVAGLLVASGCGAVDAEEEPFAGTIVHRDEGGAFALRLLEPPWLPPLWTIGTTIFIVPPADATITPDLSVVLSEALYSLEIGPETGTPATLVQALAAPLPAAAMAVQRPVRTAMKATGFELVWQEMAGELVWYHRDVFLVGPETLTYHLAFRARLPIADDPMVSQMITSFVPYI